MRKISFLLTALLLSTILFAQQVTGITNGEDGKPLAGTTVVLLAFKDSAIVKSAISKDDGQFSFTGLKSAKYLLSATHVGYKPRYSAPFEVTGTGNITVPAIVLGKGVGAMQEVKVTATRPVVEVKADKTILNVEGTINAVGQDALELLRKSPGVLVDKDDNLSLSGKNGVQIYIDGRQTPLSGADLSAFLKTLQSSNIEAIEIITNPSAKYDAAGNAGIINIRLKKNKSFGTNGSVNGGWNIGTFAKYNAGLSLNNRDKNLNLFGTYNINQSKNISYMNLYRKVLDTSFNSPGFFLYKGTTHSFKAGADYTLSKKSILGVIISGNFTEPARIRNYSPTEITYAPTNTLNRTLIADNSSKQSRENINSNLNYTYTEANGKSLVLNADYGHYNINNDQWQPNYYYSPTGVELYHNTYEMITPSKIAIYALKGDYEQNSMGGKLGLGFKSSYTKTDNDFQYYNIPSGTVKNTDNERSNLFYYKENINAAYINFNKQGKKGIMFQMGLRAEHTNLEGTSKGQKRSGTGFQPYDSTFSRNYVNLFPSAALTFNKNPMNQYSFTYSRRIDRPAYQDLNPFEFRLNEYTYMKGNTRLRPQYTNSFGITNTYKYKLTTTLNYSHVKDIFTQLPDTIEKSKAFLTKSNLATQDITSLNISYPFMYKKFTSFMNLNTYYSTYKANFGAESRRVNINVFAANLYVQNSLKIGKTWTAEMSGFFTSPSVWQGTFKSKSIGSIDMGVQKTVLAGKGNLKASVSDVFGTLRFAGESNFAGQVLRVNGRSESRQFKLNFTYRFGNMQVKAARQRTTATDDETKRTQSSGGLGQ